MQLLRASSQHTGEDYDYSALMGGSEDSGVPHGDLLIEFGEAVLGDDDGRLAKARAAIAETLGEAALVDSAGVAGLFNAIDRVADATGAPLEDWKAEDTAALREEIGINEFARAKEG